MALTLQQLVWLREHAQLDLEARIQMYPKLVSQGEMTKRDAKIWTIYAGKIVDLLNEEIEKKTDTAIEAMSAYDYET